MAVRLIEFLLPENGRGRIDEILKERSLIGHWQQTINDEMTLVRVLTESDHVETIIQSFEEKYDHLEGFRAILMEVKGTSPAVDVEPDSSQEVEPSPILLGRETGNTYDENRHLYLGRTAWSLSRANLF
jgi:hypothetical protein